MKDSSARKAFQDHIRQRDFRELNTRKEILGLSFLIDKAAPWFIFACCCIAAGYAWHYFAVMP